MATKTENKPTPSPREQSRALFREAILKAAEEEFLRAGFHKAKMTRIATAAGMASGTLYNYFDSKEKLFEAIVDSSRNDVLAAITTAYQTKDPIERIHNLVAALLDYLLEHRLLLNIYIQLGATELYELRPNNQKEIEFRQYFRQCLIQTMDEAKSMQTLKTDIPSEELATALGGLVQGFICQWAESDCASDLSENSSLILRIFLHGVKSI